MPELPELEVVRDVLQRRVVGKTITRIELFQPMAALVVRDLTGRGFAETLTGATFDNVTRRGKFLLFAFTRPVSAWLVLNPKLTGRLQLATAQTKRFKKTAVAFTLSDQTELRYYDDKTMGQLYLTDAVERVPDFAGMGPEPFDITREEFRERLKLYRGEIKGVLTRGEFLAGIGNAYADEILWHAQLHPYRKRTQLTADEIDRLYDAIQTTLRESIAQVRAAMGENIHLEPRDFLNVHLRTGEACPRCGTTISEISANQRITNFCRTCQPGGLIRGM
ncbi:MAG: Fpg/Nei family DNA glycosylase [Chloroflexi bacterium]|nr:Fpg/Nei family DNA glycosylase [Chloroflexota bacterium]